MFTWALLQVSVTLASDAFPADEGTLIFNVTPDLEIFGYVFAISLVAGILFGLTPAIESSAPRSPPPREAVLRQFAAAESKTSSSPRRLPFP